MPFLSLFSHPVGCRLYPDEPRSRVALTEAGRKTPPDSFWSTESPGFGFRALSSGGCGAGGYTGVCVFVGRMVCLATEGLTLNPILSDVSLIKVLAMSPSRGTGRSNRSKGIERLNIRSKSCISGLPKRCGSCAASSVMKWLSGIGRLLKH